MVQKAKYVLLGTILALAVVVLLGQGSPSAPRYQFFDSGNMGIWLVDGNTGMVRMFARQFVSTKLCRLQETAQYDFSTYQGGVVDIPLRMEKW